MWSPTHEEFRILVVAAIVAVAEEVILMILVPVLTPVVVVVVMVSWWRLVSLWMRRRCTNVFQRMNVCGSRMRKNERKWDVLV
jgi:hypothetical protein